MSDDSFFAVLHYQVFIFSYRVHMYLPYPQRCENFWPQDSFNFELEADISLHFNVLRETKFEATQTLNGPKTEFFVIQTQLKFIFGIALKDWMTIFS
jgi:hypothetical protein